MKGRKQGECSGCGRGKGSHDSNAGWYEMGPRRLSGYHLQHLFCPSCAAALLVGLDERMGEGKRNPNLVAVLRGDLERALSLLERVSFREQGVVLQLEHHAIVEHFSAMLNRKPWSTLTRFIHSASEGGAA